MDGTTHRGKVFNILPEKRNENVKIHMTPVSSHLALMPGNQAAWVRSQCSLSIYLK